MAIHAMKAKKEEKEQKIKLARRESENAFRAAEGREQEDEDESESQGSYVITDLNLNTFVNFLKVSLTQPVSGDSADTQEGAPSTSTSTLSCPELQKASDEDKPSHWSSRVLEVLTGKSQEDASSGGSALPRFYSAWTGGQQNTAGDNEKNDPTNQSTIEEDTAKETNIIQVISQATVSDDPETDPASDKNNVFFNALDTIEEMREDEIHRDKREPPEGEHDKHEKMEEKQSEEKADLSKNNFADALDTIEGTREDEIHRDKREPSEGEHEKHEKTEEKQSEEKADLSQNNFADALDTIEEMREDEIHREKTESPEGEHEKHEKTEEKQSEEKADTSKNNMAAEKDESQTTSSGIDISDKPDNAVTESNSSDQTQGKYDEVEGKQQESVADPGGDNLQYHQIKEQLDSSGQGLETAKGQELEKQDKPARVQLDEKSSSIEQQLPSDDTKEKETEVINISEQNKHLCENAEEKGEVEIHVHDKDKNVSDESYNKEKEITSGTSDPTQHTNDQAAEKESGGLSSPSESSSESKETVATTLETDSGENLTVPEEASPPKDDDLSEPPKPQ